MTDNSGFTAASGNNELQSSTQEIRVSIGSVNNAPAISGGPDTANLEEGDQPLISEGTLTVFDIDTTDVVNTSLRLEVSGTSDRSDQDAPSDAELAAMLELSPANPILDGTEQSDTLTWRFNSGDQSFNYLKEGETLVLTYTVTATDDNSNDPLSATETVTITITGTNDAPVITDNVVSADLPKPVLPSQPMAPSPLLIATPRIHSSLM